MPILRVQNSDGEWVEIPAIVGPQGKPGEKGEPGKTAYQYAKDGGYTGTEQEFAAKLPQECATPAEVNAAVKKAAPRNLLDNSDFRNPVNQRGVTGTSGRGTHTFDRWYIDSSNGNGYWDAKPGVGFGMNVNGDSWMVFVQRIAGLDRTKTYTIAFQDGYGNVYINNRADIVWHDAYAEARIVLHTGTMTVVWAALYEGEYTEETLPEYQPKGYGAELAECRRYFRKYDAELVGVFFWNNAVAVQGLERSPMAISNPTVSVKNITSIDRAVDFTGYITNYKVDENGLIYVGFSEAVNESIGKYVYISGIIESADIP